ncbi:hypothetical protein ACP70R_047298 [Stipagrostis hirtigluma subsp. patula]
MRAAGSRFVAAAAADVGRAATCCPACISSPHRLPSPSPHLHPIVHGPTASTPKVGGVQAGCAAASRAPSPPSPSWCRSTSPTTTSSARSRRSGSSARCRRRTKRERGAAVPPRGRATGARVRSRSRAHLPLRPARLPYHALICVRVPGPAPAPSRRGCQRQAQG